MKVIRSIRSWTEDFLKVNKITEDFLVLYEFLEAGEAEPGEVEKAYDEAIREIEDLEAKNMLRNEEDRLGAVLRINAPRTPFIARPPRPSAARPRLSAGSCRATVSR